MAETRRYPMLVACFSLFLSLVGFGIIIPVQPFYAESLGATPLMVTSLGAIFSLMQFLCAPLWGRLSDRVGRRPVMLGTIVIGGLGHLGFGMARTFPALFVVRAIAGLGMANQGTAQAIVSDITRPEDRARGMGMIGAAFGLGFIVGPALGGFLGQYDVRYPAFAAAGLSALNWIMAWRWLPETRVAREQAEARAGSRFAGGAILRVMREYDVGRVMVTTLVVSLGFSAMEQVISLFLEHSYVGVFVLSRHDRMSMATRLTAWFLVVVGVVAVAVQGGLIGVLRRRLGEPHLIRVGIVLMSLSMAAFPLLAHTGVFSAVLIAAGGLAFGSGLYNPSSSSLISLEVGAAEQGVVLGANQSMGALGRIVGPLLGGLLYQTRPEWPFFCAAALLVVAWWIARGISRSEASPTVAP